MALPPLFFIHGMWSTPKVWDWLKARYEDRGYRVFAPALPFHDADRAQPPDPLLATTGVRDYVDALLAAGREVGEAPIIVGHSMGGMLAQKLAAEQGARGLALLAPAPTAQTGSLTLNSARTLLGVTTSGKWWKNPTMIDEQRARWGIFNGVPEAEVREALGDLVWDSGRVLFQIGMPFADREKATDVDYSRLDMPAIVMVGDEDRITPVATARATARRLEGEVDYIELPGVGHWLFHDPVRERVAEELDRLILRI
ncbi:MAG: alpha/beta hydrolase [Pacificimonas sp.]|jgi:pimeloyl-ACP methyl ester carboxylesterase|nr:alpha/beta hydrolase [Pacificimonas sp.]